MHLLAQPFLADADIGQVIFVIVALVAGFIQWLIKVIKDKAEAASRSRHVPTKEETEARYRSWEEQTRPSAPPNEKPQPPQHTFEEMFAEVRKAMSDEGTKTPPPLPAPVPPITRPSPPVPPGGFYPVLTTPKPLAPVPAPVFASPTIAVESQRDRRVPHPFTRMLHTPEGYRHAFVLREVLGPPRALREYGGPED